MRDAFILPTFAPRGAHVPCLGEGSMPINRRDLLKITSASGVALAGGSPATLRGPTQAAAASELTASTSAEPIGYSP